MAVVAESVDYPDRDLALSWLPVAITGVVFSP